jgi:hypothetical protein
MQGIYTYIPETNNVPKQYNVAAILSLLFIGAHYYYYSTLVTGFFFLVVLLNQQ